jgi:Protein of unknown function (DUF2891)
MKQLFLTLFITASLNAFAQTQTLTRELPDGRLTLSDKGVSYFTKLSMNCANNPYPHFYMERLQKAEDLKPPDKLWPSFYGCYDWHSGVHNHWALLKLLKAYPGATDAAAIKQKLELSFNADNILQEVKYFQSHEEDQFEFPYGTTWLLKIADELINWNDPQAKKWLKNLTPLTDYITARYMLMWTKIPEATFTGDHFSSAFGLSFALDYSRSAKKDSLEKLIIETSRNFYLPITKFPLIKEPFGYDFMSAGLLIADLMRKVLPQAEFEKWLKAFAPELFTIGGVNTVLFVKNKEDHSGYASHWDGYHLNRIWCLNGILKSITPSLLPENVKKEWISMQKEMWEYAQASIGKGNYDVDHWLSSFSVFALEGYK